MDSLAAASSWRYRVAHRLVLIWIIWVYSFLLHPDFCFYVQLIWMPSLRVVPAMMLPRVSGGPTMTLNWPHVSENENV